MSQANTELRALAEAAYAALNAGDLDAFTALTGEDVEFTSMIAEAEGTTFRGHPGIRVWWDTVRGEFEDVRWEAVDLRGTGDRGIAHFRIVGRLSGVPVEQVRGIAAGPGPPPDDEAVDRMRFEYLAEKYLR